MELFQNEQIDISNLPQAKQLEMHGLEPSYKSVLLISRTIFTLILAVLTAIFVFVPMEDKPPSANYVAIGLFIFITIWGYISTIKGFHHKRYASREKDIVYSSGWLWKQTTIAPFNRVQHVSIAQGPIERQFELSKLKIFTAGGKSSDMSIPGLNPETANKLKEYIVSKALDEQSDEVTTLLTTADDEQE